MEAATNWHAAKLVQIDQVAEDVRRLTWETDWQGGRFDPGSHVQLSLIIDGKVEQRSFSCLPGTGAGGRIVIGGRLRPDTRGGSRYLFGLQPGARISITEPANHFPLDWRAPAHALVAGGIGITPIMGMAYALQQRGLPFALHYAGRSVETMPFVDELTERLGTACHTYRDEAGERINLKAVIDTLPPGGQLYLCGPISMLEAAKTLWAQAGRPLDGLRFETFGDSGRHPTQAFEVEVADHGVRVTVPAGRSMLDALEDAGIEMMSDCRRGECGICAVTVLEHDTAIDHRDVFLSEHQKTEGGKMCACVSRAAGGRVVIDTGLRQAKSKAA